MPINGLTGLACTLVLPHKPVINAVCITTRTLIMCKASGMCHYLKFSFFVANLVFEVIFSLIKVAIKSERQTNYVNR